MRLTKRITKLVITASVSLTVLGCGSGFQTQPAASVCAGDGCSNNAPSGDSGKDPSVPGNPAWESLEFNGTVNGGLFDKTQVVRIDKAAKELIVRLPMSSNPYLDGVIFELPIERLPGSRLTLDPLPNGGSALALRIPLSYVLDGVKFLPPSRLPNGDPLPAIPAGELPATAIRLTQNKDIKATIYLGPTVVGIYVNTPFDPYMRVSFPVRNESRTRTLGYFSTIPAKSGYEGGFFVSISLPDDIARIIDDNI